MNDKRARLLKNPLPGPGARVTLVLRTSALAIVSRQLRPQRALVLIRLMRALSGPL